MTLFVPPQMFQRNPYGQGSSSFTIDPSWYGVVNKIQLANGAQADVYLPSVAAMTDATFIGIYPCMDGGITVIHPNGADTICGNPGPWYMMQDENVGFVSDFLAERAELWARDATFRRAGTAGLRRSRFLANALYERFGAVQLLLGAAIRQRLPDRPAA